VVGEATGDRGRGRGEREGGEGEQRGAAHRAMVTQRR
jgi:hypothetical protein